MKPSEDASLLVSRRAAGEALVRALASKHLVEERPARPPPARCARSGPASPRPPTGVWPIRRAPRANEAERRFAFADTHRMLTQRIGIFISLPISSRDRLSLEHRLDEIGRMQVDTSPEKA